MSACITISLLCFLFDYQNGVMVAQAPSLPPTGHQVSLVVVSELSSCGEFWAQVAIEEEEEEEQYKSMAEQLQCVSLC